MGRELSWTMNSVEFSWLYVAVTPEGIRCPGRENSVDTKNFARIPGRWLNPTEFETTNGILVVPAPGPDGVRDGEIIWRQAATTPQVPLPGSPRPPAN